MPVDIFKPIVADKAGAPPLYLRVQIPFGGYTQGGTPPPQKQEVYVLLSALPTELKERVKTAIQMLATG